MHFHVRIMSTVFGYISDTLTEYCSMCIAFFLMTYWRILVCIPYSIRRCIIHQIYCSTICDNTDDEQQTNKVHFLCVMYLWNLKHQMFILSLNMYSLPLQLSTERFKIINCVGCFLNCLMVPGIVTITLEHCNEVKSGHKSMEETKR